MSEPGAAGLQEQLSRLALGTARYSAGGIVARALTFLSVPIYLRWISAEEFGLQAIALLNEQVLGIVAASALTNGIARQYTTATSAEGRRAVVATAAVASAAAGFTLFGLWNLAIGPASALTMDGSARADTILRLVGVSFLFTMFFNLALTVLQLDERAVAYSALNVVKYGLAVLLGVAFLAAGLGVVGIVLGWAIASGLAGGAALAWLVRRFGLRPDGIALSGLLRYGLPLVPAGLLTLVLNSNDRYLLRQLAGLEAVGVFVAAYALASVFNLLVVTPFRQAWAPAMWKVQGHADEHEFHRRVLRYYVAAQVVVTFAVAVVCEFAMSVMSGGRPEFVAAALIVPVLYSGFALFGAYDVLAAGYFLRGRTVFYAATVALTTGASVALNLLLIPGFGVWGAATAYALSYLCFALLSLAFGRRYLSVGHEWRRIGAAVALGLAAALLFAAARGLGSVFGLVAGVGLLLALPIGLVAVGAIARAELSAALAVLPWAAASWRARSTWPAPRR